MVIKIRRGVIPKGIIVGCLLFLLYKICDKFTISTEMEGKSSDIADLFVPPGTKYDLNNNIIYHCLSGTIFTTTSPHKETRIFSADTKGRRGEEANARAKSFLKVFEKQIWQILRKTPLMNKTSDRFQSSGEGSSLESAQPPLALLNSLIERLKIFLNKPVITILDIPCGDFFWMKELVGRRVDIQYTGVDIVPTLIKRHKKHYKSWNNAKFLNLDIVTSGLNQSYDIIFSRDFIQHLTFADALKVLEYFSSSGSKILVSTHMHNMENIELNTAGGRYRPLNLMISPINLVAPICSMKDNRANEIEELAVWKLPLLQRV